MTWFAPKQEGRRSVSAKKFGNFLAGCAHVNGFKSKADLVPIANCLTSKMPLHRGLLCLPAHKWNLATSEQPGIMAIQQEPIKFGKDWQYYYMSGIAKALTVSETTKAKREVLCFVLAKSA